MYSKNKVSEYIFHYSRYYGNLLGNCENISNDNNGHASLIYLFNLLESVIKSQINDYDISFINAIKKLKTEQYINEIEYNFLNNQETGIRRIRNLLAHANLAKYNIVFLNVEQDILYPLTENDSCIKLYNLVSELLFNLILKIVYKNDQRILINIDEGINNFKIEIKEVTPEKLLEYKGIFYKDIKGWDNLREDDKYRMVENTSDVNMYISLFNRIEDAKINFN